MENAPKLMAVSDDRIISICMWKDKLIVATERGVFQNDGDGKFHLMEFIYEEKQ